MNVTTFWKYYRQSSTFDWMSGKHVCYIMEQKSGTSCGNLQYTAPKIRLKSSFSHCTMHKDVSFWMAYASTKLIGGSAMQSEWGHSQKCRGPKIGLKVLILTLYHAQRCLILDSIRFNKTHWWECYAIRMRSLTKVQRPKDWTQSPHSYTVPCTKISHSGWHTLQQSSLVGVLCTQNVVTHKSAEAQRLDSKSSLTHCTMHKDSSFW